MQEFSFAQYEQKDKMQAFSFATYKIQGNSFVQYKIGFRKIARKKYRIYCPRIQLYPM
jgi:hypothetical protein